MQWNLRVGVNRRSEASKLSYFFFVYETPKSLRISSCSSSTRYEYRLYALSMTRVSMISEVTRVEPFAPTQETLLELTNDNLVERQGATS